MGNNYPVSTIVLDIKPVYVRKSRQTPTDVPVQNSDMWMSFDFNRTWCQEPWLSPGGTIHMPVYSYLPTKNC